MFLTRTAEGHVLIEQHVVADFGGFADDDAHAMVNEEALADAGSGVDLNAGEGAGDVAHHAGDGVPAAAIKPMGQPVQENRVDAGVEQQDLQCVPGGRVALVDGIDLFTDGPEHGIS